MVYYDSKNTNCNLIFLLGSDSKTESNKDKIDKPKISIRHREKKGVPKKIQNKNIEDLIEDSMEESVDKMSHNDSPWTQTMNMRFDNDDFNLYFFLSNLNIRRLYRRDEVELLLRRPIHNDADIHFTLASAEAGLLFMDEVFILLLFIFLFRISYIHSIFSLLA